MSVVCSRLALPAVSSVSGRCLRLRAPFTRLLHLTTTADAKHLAQATALSPEDNSQFPTLHPDKRSLPTFESLSSHQKDQITLYVRTLLQWNQTMNLTAVTEESEVMTRHVEDSLAILPPLRRSYLSHFRGASSWDGLNVIDVGSGAGLPGLVLAIACPSWKITLLESMKKRCSFLEHIVALTGLSNVQILCERAENIGQCADFRELFDVAVARAVAEMRILAEYCLPLVHVGGLFLAAKGSDPQEEVKRAENAIRLMGASILDLCTETSCVTTKGAERCIASSGCRLEVYFNDLESLGPKGQRTTIICAKDRATPRKYPRQPGTPTKMPL